MTGIGRNPGRQTRKKERKTMFSPQPCTGRKAPRPAGATGARRSGRRWPRRRSPSTGAGTSAPARRTVPSHQPVPFVR
eukprot:gene16577-biopygen15831